MNESITRSAEFRRIFALPRRPCEPNAEIAYELTVALRTDERCPRCGGHYEHASTCMVRDVLPIGLRPLQAMAISECYENGGLLAPIGVGHGKFLMFFLMPGVLGAVRPTYICPANLIDDSRRRWEALARYWQIATNIQILSYEWLGLVQGKRELEREGPGLPPRDLLMLDEASKVKHKTAARTKRMDRFVKGRREAGGGLIVAAASGTLTSGSIRDFAHIAQWCLPNQCPLPENWHELDLWRRALDDDLSVNPLERVSVGAFLDYALPEDEGLSARDIGRAVFRRRLNETPGVVASSEQSLGTSLDIDSFDLPEDEAIRRAFEDLRDEMTLPDGWECIDGLEVSRYAKQLARGYYQVWDPRPPQSWLDARAVWCKFVRDVIKQGEYDSELDVRQAYSDVPEWLQWQNGALWDFDPNPVPCWISDAVLDHVAALAEPGLLLWSSSVPFARRLSERSGLPYFAEGGLNSDGLYIEDHDGPAILSIDANFYGRNLQHKWHKNLICTPRSSGELVEQLLGRTHRSGQRADSVSASFALGCREDARSFWSAHSRAHTIQGLMGGAQKLCYANVTVPTLESIERRAGARWRPASKKPAQNRGSFLHDTLSP